VPLTSRRGHKTSPLQSVLSDQRRFLMAFPAMHTFEAVAARCPICAAGPQSAAAGRGVTAPRTGRKQPKTDASEAARRAPRQRSTGRNRTGRAKPVRAARNGADAVNTNAGAESASRIGLTVARRPLTRRGESAKRCASRATHRFRCGKGAVGVTAGDKTGRGRQPSRCAGFTNSQIKHTTTASRSARRT